MGLVVKSKLFHERGKIAVIVVPIVEVLLIRCVQEVFTRRSIEPYTISIQKLHKEKFRFIILQYCKDHNHID